jgi:hypothetical protein
VLLSLSTVAAFMVRLPQLQPLQAPAVQQQLQQRRRQSLHRQRQASVPQPLVPPLSAATSFAPSKYWFSNSTSSGGGSGRLLFGDPLSKQQRTQKEQRLQQQGPPPPTPPQRDNEDGSRKKNDPPPQGRQEDASSSSSSSSSSSPPPQKGPGGGGDKENWRFNHDRNGNNINNDNIIPNNGDVGRSKSNQDQPAYYTIPVLGPFAGQPPLLLGGELILNPPSPLQWKTITECVEVHNQAIKSLYQNATNAASLDAAPLVAILESDDNDDGTDKIRGGYRYATLAAIVGVTSNNQFLDTGDAEAFRQALQEIHSASSTYFQPESRIRMVGIGRAQLSRFGTKEKETIVKSIRNYRVDGTRDWQQEEAIDAFEDGPILLARMHLMLDGPQPATPVPGLGNPFNSIVINKQCSPVHSLSDMSMWVSRITFMHLDRQKLVQGLQAATVRLEMPHFANWEDHDGIGALYDKKEQVKETQAAEDLNPHDSLSRTLAAAFSTLGIETPDGGGESSPEQDDVSSSATAPTTTYDPQRTFQEKINSLLLSYEADKKNAHKPLSAQSSQLLELANYGMGYSAASFFQPLDSSTRILMERLAPYYSHQHVASEEFYYQVYSLVALHSLQTYLQRDTLTSMELLEALKSTNTVARLKQVFDWMLEHKLLLQELARKKSQELRDRGENVSDLW